MTVTTPTGCELWVGDRWINHAAGEGLVRITAVDPYLGLVEAQGEGHDDTTVATVDVFVATHRPVDRSELSAEHGWR